MHIQAFTQLGKAVEFDMQMHLILLISTYAPINAFMHAYTAHLHTHIFFSLCEHTQTPVSTLSRTNKYNIGIKWVHNAHVSVLQCEIYSLSGCCCCCWIASVAHRVLYVKYSIRIHRIGSCEHNCNTSSMHMQ